MDRSPKTDEIKEFSILTFRGRSVLRVVEGYPSFFRRYGEFALRDDRQSRALPMVIDARR